MPDENVPKDPQTPKPQLKSLDGFTNSPKPVGPPTPPSQPSNSFNPNLAPPNQPSDNLSSNSLVPDNQFSSGGIQNPTVTGMAGPPNTPHSSLPTMPEPAPQSQAPVITTHKKSHKKLWMSVLVLLVLLGLGAGYAFAFYLPNQPNNVYKTSLTNTGLAVDKLIDYSRTQQQAHYKSTSFDGKVNFKSPDFSFDSSFNGNISKDNGQIQATADAMSQHVSANVKYVTKSGNDSPDVYVQVSGVKTLLSQNGLGSLSKLDSQWIVIDHTLIDSYKSSLQKEAQAITNDKNAQMDKAPTMGQINDAIDKVQVVNKQYIFTTDASKAVLTNNQYLGKDTVNGRTMYHYKVGYNKAHLKAYVTAVGQALDNSQLNDWAKKVDGGKNISDELNFKNAGKNIDQMKSGYTFDMWADAKTKLISKLTFADANNKNDTFSISQNYTGGVVYPFSINLTSKDDSGNPANITIGYVVNSSTHKVSLTFKSNSKDSSGATSIDGSFNITPSNNAVTETAPTGAKPIMSVLQSLGLGSALSGNPNIPACKTGDTKCNAQVSNPGCDSPYLMLACNPSSTGNGGVNPGGLNQGGITCTSPAAGTAKCLASSTNKT